MGSTWGQPGVHLGSTWGQPALPYLAGLKSGEEDGEGGERRRFERHWRKLMTKCGEARERSEGFSGGRGICVLDDYDEFACALDINLASEWVSVANLVSLM